MTKVNKAKEFYYGTDWEEENPSERQEKNPAITNPRWEDADGKPITKALVGDEVTLCADTHNIADGASATIKIVEKDADGNDDDVATLSAKVQNNKIECAWKVVYTADDDDADSQQEQEEKGYTLPEYAFSVECDGEKSAESGQLDVRGWIRTKFTDEQTGELLKNKRYRLYSPDGKTIVDGTTNDEGYIDINDLDLSKYFVYFLGDEK